MNKLIVYGTLLRGEHNHFMMEGAEFLGEVIIPNAVIYDLGGCPGLNFSDAENTVKGELYMVDGQHLQRLDHFEGHPNTYKRIMHTYCASDDPGNELGVAGVYEYQDTPYEPHIPGGDWRQRHNLP